MGDIDLRRFYASALAGSSRVHIGAEPGPCGSHVARKRAPVFRLL